MSSHDPQIQHCLPFLPGYVFKYEEDKKKANFRKSHIFDYCNNVAVFDDFKPGIGGEYLLGQKECLPITSSHYYDQMAKDKKGVPSWVAFDRQVLRFFAYFQESVEERREENYRVRRVFIYFYLEDDSVQVIEPRVENSGIPQGTLISRHRIKVPNTKSHYIISDLNVGKQVTFYGRTFYITGCDSFTREFLGGIGIEVPQNEDNRVDPYSEHRKELLERMRPTRPYVPNLALKKFLENDRKVLRFFCVWDDTDSVFGDERNMVLHYFLADDTIEIREHIPPNAGRDNVTLFLKRAPLPKRVHIRIERETILKADEYYTDKDLGIGVVLTLYGRHFLICDCDDFTKQWYYDKYGIDHFDPIVLGPRRNKTADYETIAVPANHQDSHPVPATTDSSTATTTAAAQQPKEPLPGDIDPATGRKFPPYNGFGSEDDSLGSCIALVPKPPKKDFKKLMKDTRILRFSAMLNTHKQVDKDRRFVISYYPTDDTVQVFEPPMRNSGIRGGKFMERGRKKKPDGSLYQAKDFYVGSQVILNCHPFVIIDADEYVQKYMTQNPDEFPRHDTLQNTTHGNP